VDRLALVYRLRAGAKDTYIQAHHEIWPEMRDFLVRAGVAQMTTFLRGDTLFLYAEIADLRAYQELERVDPVSRRWEAWMATLLDQPFDDRELGIFADLTEIWHFPLEDGLGMAPADR
jgi:L-rhamnose mutarotase